MQKIEFYFKGHTFGYECAILDWYCKPSILRCLALKSGALFITSSKYPNRKFFPELSVSFPVYNFEFKHYEDGLPLLVIEFSDNSSFDLRDSNYFLSTYEENL